MIYKEYDKCFIGVSDIASLILVGCGEEDVECKFLRFGEDGAYKAYMVDRSCPIPEHYRLVNTFYHWLKIYDDLHLATTIHSDIIKIYRAGSFGCIIQTIEK